MTTYKTSDLLDFAARKAEEMVRHSDMPIEKMMIGIGVLTAAMNCDLTQKEYGRAQRLMIKMGTVVALKQQALKEGKPNGKWDSDVKELCGIAGAAHLLLMCEIYDVSIVKILEDALNALEARGNDYGRI